MTEFIFLDEAEPTLYQPYVDEEEVARNDMAVDDALTANDDTFREDALYYLKSRCLKETAPTGEVDNEKLLKAVEYAAYEEYNA